MKSDIRDFVGVFDDVVSKEFCDDVINYYKYVQDSSLTCSRQAAEGIEKFKKQDDTYFFQDEMQSEFQLHNTNILQEANRAFADCLNAYFNHYDILYSTNYGVYSYRLQKTPVNGGYHVWHHERGNMENQHRFLAFILYLNDVEVGGETEFHYYPRRVEAKAGRVLVCPADFTHTHRGNPPLSNDKYIIATWASYTK
jgi:hypothetical protein